MMPRATRRSFAALDMVELLTLKKGGTAMAMKACKECKKEISMRPRVQTAARRTLLDQFRSLPSLAVDFLFCALLS